MKKVKCARCEADTEGYTAESGKVMVLHEDGQYYNSWVWGCVNCNPVDEGTKYPYTAEY